jgi:hypothetical protein
VFSVLLDEIQLKWPPFGHLDLLNICVHSGTKIY